MLNKRSKKKRFTFRRIKNWVLGIIGLTVIFMAISFTLIRVAIKSVPDYAIAIQEAVSEELDIKLEVDIVDAEIYWLVPRLNLYNVDVYDQSGKNLFLHANKIDLSLDWANTIRTMLPAISEITLDGIALQIGVNKKKQVLVQNFVVNENVDDVLRQANNATSGLSLQLGEGLLSDDLQFVINNLDFTILNSQINFFDERNPKHNKTLNKFNLRLLNSGDEHQFEVQAALPGSYGNHLHVVMDIEGDLFDYKNLLGELYVSVDNIRLAPWFDDYWNDSGFAINARVYAQGWLSWQELEVTDVQGYFNLMDVGIHYLGTSVNTWKLNQIDGRVKWQKEQDGWQLDVRDLKSIRKGGQWPEPTAASIKVSDEKQEVRLQANFLRVGGLAYLAGMANSLIDENIPWLDILDKHQPSGDLHDLDVSFPIHEPQKIKVNTKFSNISFSLPGMEPAAVKNLQGSIVYLENKTWLALDAKNSQLKFKKLFRNPIDLTALRGALEISYLDERLSVLTNSLHIETPHISTESRFDLSVLNGKPFLDLTTKYNNGNAKYLGRYLPAGIMGKETLSWLDKGILSGQITEGGYQIYGELDDFPFRQRQGVSLADFNVSGVKLKYLKDWPTINNIAGNVRVENDSLLINANKGKIFDSNITQTKVYIDSFQSPNLDVEGKMNIQLSDVSRYIKESALINRSSEYIHNVELSGNGKLNLNLFIPLVDNSHVEWGGVLATENGGVKLINENYNFTDLNASISFTDAFFEAKFVKAKLDGKPLEIDLVTNSNSDAMIYRMKMQGNLSAQTFLSPIPEAKKYVSGNTDWDVSIDITKNKFSNAGGLSINIESDLQGVSLQLPGPLSKQETEIVPMLMTIQKKFGSYMEYNLSLGSDRALALNEFSDNWLLKVDAPSVKGTLNVGKARQIIRPAEVDLTYFNVNDFLNSNEITTAEVQEEIIPRDIPAINFKAQKMSWNKFNFNTAEISTRQTRLGVVVDKLKLVANDYTVTGEGNWYSGWKKQHTTGFNLDVNVNNLGHALKELDLTSNLKDTEGKAHVRLTWKDMPHNFSWEKLQGDGRVDLKNGTIKQVEVGAGRVLGLINLQTLLSLDFANQVSKGFTFDQVNGSFSFSDGKSYTDDLRVESKVADVYINGEFDIESATVDQKVRVRPHVESTVALGTAVIAGPTVGGLVYLFQKVFTPDRLSDYEYSIKGKADDPVVELISVPATIADDDDDEDDSDY